MRKLLLSVGVALLVWASVVVPIPLAVAVPVPAIPVTEVVEVEGDALDDLEDQLRFTVVRLEQPTVAGAVAAVLDAERSLSPVPTVSPPGAEEGTFLEFQQRLFRESLRVAFAVGLERAGESVEISGDGVRVLEVLPVGPAAEVLQREDVITEVDGQPVELVSDLARRLDAVEPGSEVEVGYRREGEQRTATLEVVPLQERAGDLAGLAIGVIAATVELQLEAPVDVEATAAEEFGGPSAGLVLALAAYEATSGAELAAGRVIAGTGTIDLQGRVGRVDGIPQKVRGAIEAGAEVFLVPSEGAQQARTAAQGRLEVVEVDTLDGAISALTDR